MHSLLHLGNENAFGCWLSYAVASFGIRSWIFEQGVWRHWQGQDQVCISWAQGGLAMASKNPEIPTIFYGEPSLLPLPQYGFCRQNSILWCWNWFGWNIKHRFHQHYAGHYLLPKSTSFGDWVQPLDDTNLHNAHCKSWVVLYCQWCLLGYPHSMRLLWKSCRGNIWRSFARSTQGFCSMAKGSWCIVIPKTI